MNLADSSKYFLLITGSIFLIACTSTPDSSSNPEDNPIILNDPNGCNFNGQCSNPGGVESSTDSVGYEDKNSNGALEKQAESLRKRQEQRTRQVMEKNNK